MALMSPSLRGLQCLLLACEQYCKDWDICLNPKKSRNLYFRACQNSLCKLKLNRIEIEWAEKWTYLGKLGFCIKNRPLKRQYGQWFPMPH